LPHLFSAIFAGLWRLLKEPGMKAEAAEIAR